MKNIFLCSIALLSMAFRPVSKITVCAYIYRLSEVKAQNVINYSDFLGHKYSLLVTNTVGATTPSNAASVFVISKDTTWLMLPNIKFPSITSGTTVIAPGNKMFSMNSNKMLCATDFSLMSFPYSQVTGTPVIPTAYTLTASEIYAKITYTPYNSTNPSGYISSYSETDPLFNSKFSGKSTTDLIEGSNLYYTSARFNATLAGKTTADLSEGSNLYFTAARTRTTISAGTGIGYVSGTGVITNSSPHITTTLTAGKNTTVTSSSNSFTVGCVKSYTTYSGNTNASGDYVVAFSAAYSVAPFVIPSIPNQSDYNALAVVTSVTTTGFTIHVFTRPTVSSLPIIGILSVALLGATTTNVNSQSVDVLVIEK